MFTLLESISPAVGGAAVIVGCLLGAFVLYVGLTLAVTLFHPNPDRRRHAAGILRQLLHFLRNAR